MAPIRALETLTRAPLTVQLYTDSIYVRDGITKWLPRWKAQRLADLREAAGQERRPVATPGRRGAPARRRVALGQGPRRPPENERADRLATRGLQEGATRARSPSYPTAELQAGQPTLAVMNRLVAPFAATVHMVFVAFTVIGGFVAFLVPWLLLPHLAVARGVVGRPSREPRAHSRGSENWVVPAPAAREAAGRARLHLPLLREVGLSRAVGAPRRVHRRRPDHRFLAGPGAEVIAAATRAHAANATNACG